MIAAASAVAPESLSPCRYCDSAEVRFINNEEVYGSPKGAWPYIWMCTNCKARVGCHPNTRLPLGILANTPLRRLRMEKSRVFEPLWSGRSKIFPSRYEAYRWLGGAMGIPVTECHWGMFDTERCELAIRLCEELQQKYAKLLSVVRDCPKTSD